MLHRDIGKAESFNDDDENRDIIVKSRRNRGPWAIEDVENQLSRFCAVVYIFT